MGLFSPSSRSGRARLEREQREQEEREKKAEERRQQEAQERFDQQYSQAQQIIENPERFGFMAGKINKQGQQIFIKRQDDEKTGDTQEYEKITAQGGAPVSYYRRDYSRGVSRYITEYDFTTGRYINRAKDPSFSQNIAYTTRPDKKYYIYTKGKRETGRYVSKPELRELTAPKRRAPLDVYQKVDIQFTKSGIKGDIGALSKEQQQEVGREYVAWQRGLKQPLRGREKIEAQSAAFAQDRQSSAYNDRVFSVMEQFKAPRQDFTLYKYGRIKLGPVSLDIGREAQKYDILSQKAGRIIDEGRPYAIGGRGAIGAGIADKTKAREEPLVSGYTRATIGSYFIPGVGHARFYTEGVAYAATVGQAVAGNYDARQMIAQNKIETGVYGVVYSLPLIVQGSKAAYRGVKLAKAKISTARFNRRFAGQIVTKENYQIVKTTKDLQRELSIREIMSYTAKQQTRKSKFGTTTKTKVYINLGRRQMIDASKLTREGRVALSGDKQTLIFIGSRANIASKTKGAVIIPKELTSPTGTLIYKREPLSIIRPFKDFARMFVTGKSVTSSKGSVSASKLTFSGNLMLAEQTTYSTAKAGKVINVFIFSQGKIKGLPPLSPPAPDVVKPTYNTVRYAFFKPDVFAKAERLKFGGLLNTQYSGKQIPAVFSRTYNLARGTGRALFVYDPIINPGNTQPFFMSYVPKPVPSSSIFGTIKTAFGEISAKKRTIIPKSPSDQPLGPGEILAADGTVLKLVTPTQQYKERVRQRNDFDIAQKKKAKTYREAPPAEKPAQNNVQSQEKSINVVSDTKISQNIKQSSDTIIKQTSGVKFRQRYSFVQAAAQAQGFDFAQAQAQDQIPINDKSFDGITKIILKQETLQRPRQTETIARQYVDIPGFPPPRFRPGSRIPQEGIPLIPPPKIDLPQLNPQRKKEQGFNVLIRRRGKFIIASPSSLSKSEAIQFGAVAVGNSAAASFKIVEAGGPAVGKFAGRGNIKDFIKKAGNIFIEKPSRRIKSIGELQEITFKGIQSQKKGIFGLKLKNPFR